MPDKQVEQPRQRSAIRSRALWAALAIYAVSSWVVIKAVDSLTGTLQLPSWFPAMALVLLLIGLPVVLATAFVQRRSSSSVDAESPSSTEGGVRVTSQGAASTAEQSATTTGVSVAPNLFTWRNAFLGGVAAFALWGALAAVWVVSGRASYVGGGTDEEGSRSVAVLPLDNLSPDPNDAYFADGIHEEIIAQLYRVGGLKVISRTSVMEYREHSGNLRQIAEQLGVSSVLEGSVRRAGDRVRITVQLIDAATDVHLWAETFERPMDDVFAVQAEVAVQIARVLGTRLSTEETGRVDRRPTESVEAYDHFLRGSVLELENPYDEALIREAISEWERAVEIDPEFAGAWLAIVHGRTWLAWNFLRFEEAGAAAAALDRLYSLGPDLDETHEAAGYYHYYTSRDFEGAWREFDIVARRQPGYAWIHALTGYALRRLGRWDEGLAAERRAVELDPRSPRITYNLGLTLGKLGLFDEADALLRRTIDLDPDWFAPRESYFFRLLQRGDSAGARKALEDAVSVLPAEEMVHARATLAGIRGGAHAALNLWISEFGGVPARRLEFAQRWALLAGDTTGARAYADSLRIVSEEQLQAIRATPQAGRVNVVLGNLALSHAILGSRTDALAYGRQSVDALLTTEDLFQKDRDLLWLAYMYVVLGEWERALDALEENLAAPSSYRREYFEIDPLLAPLRDHPRFQELPEGYVHRTIRPQS